jgi:MFS family permease
MSKQQNIIIFIILFITTIFCGIISTLMGVYLPLAVKDLLAITNKNEITEITATINAVFIFGASFGGFLGGLVSDKIGRKKSTTIAIACLGLSTLVTAFVHTWYGVMSCRFFSGVGVGAILVISFTYLNETWPAKTSRIYSGILSIAFPIGIFSAGTINYFVSNWQQGFLIGIFPLAIAIISFFILTESDAWLQNKIQKTALADEVLFTQKHKANLIKGAFIFGTMLIGLWAIFLWLPSWIQSMSNNTNVNKDTGTSMMLLGAGGLIGGFYSGWLMNFLGTKKSLLLCFFVCSIFSFILFFTNSTVSNILFIEIGLLAFFFGASQGILSAYIPQLFPTNIKASAIGFCFNAGRLLTAFAVLFVGLLVNTFGGYGNTLLIFSNIFLIGLVIVYFSKYEK